MHAKISGLADYLAVDELDGIRLGRQVVRRLSATGREAYAAVAPLAKAIEEELASHMSARRLRDLRSGMAQLVEAANTVLHDDRDWRHFVADPAPRKRKKRSSARRGSGAAE